MVLPSLKGKLSGNAVRVPVTDVSLLDLTVALTNPCTPQTFAAAVATAAGTTMKGVISLSNEEKVSSDFKGCHTSCIVLQDASVFLTDKFIKISCFYDNESAYAAKLLDLSLFVMIQDFERPETTHGLC